MEKNGVSVFDFTEDFRDYLKYIIKEHRFSYRAIAEKAGLDHRLVYDVVNKVVHRDKPRHLTLIKALKLSDALGHLKNERDYFVALVFLTQTTDDDEREYYQSHLLKIKSELPDVTPPPKLDTYEFYTSLHHSVIRSIIGMYPFDGDFQWMAKKILPPLTVDQARQSVQLLERLGLIRKDNKGVFQLTEKTICADISDMGKKFFHRACSDITRKQIFYAYPDDCQALNATLGMSSKTYEFVCEENEKTLNKVIKAVNCDKNADRVYQYQLSIVPLSEKN